MPGGLAGPEVEAAGLGRLLELGRLESELALFAKVEVESPRLLEVEYIIELFGEFCDLLFFGRRLVLWLGFA